MYEAFFGFRERPFQLTPNPRFLFLNPGHREALATLRYGLTSSLGITLLLGEAGTGKTTLLRAALHAEQHPDYRHAVLRPTRRCRPRTSTRSWRTGSASPTRPARRGASCRPSSATSLERHEAGGPTALVVDEAQSLTHELFEEIRLLANLETETAKLVNVVLVGQPELADRLNDPSLRQLKQRVVLRRALAPSTSSRRPYIATRLRVAGASPGEVFTKDAVRAIHHASRGIPRAIGVICENALLAGYAAQKKPVDRATSPTCAATSTCPSSGNGPPPAQHAPRAGHDAARARRRPQPAAPPREDPARAARVALVDSRGGRPLSRTARSQVLLTPASSASAGDSDPGEALKRTSCHSLRSCGEASPCPGAGAPSGQAAAGRRPQQPSRPRPAGRPWPPTRASPSAPRTCSASSSGASQEMSGDVTVRPDGMITLPLIRDVKAAGLTPDAAGRPHPGPRCASTSPTPRSPSSCGR